jgi:Holliday junction resolvase RusA-like endonuclease
MLHTITVYGTPVPQGSKTAVVRGGRAVMYEANKGHKGYRQLVTWEVSNYIGNNEIEPYKAHEPLVVDLTFFMPRPKTVTRQYPTVKPDADKLTRTILDSLVKAGLFADDAQVIELHVYKHYDVDPRVKITIYNK